MLPPDVLRLASDERLVAAVRAGSERAFEALYRRHHDPILAYCLRILGSSHEAEDAVQHAFMAAYVDIMTSGKSIVLRPWLYTIARHRCVTVLRARRDPPVGTVNEPAGRHLTTELDVREDLRAMVNDIAQLPDDQRIALVLTELGGASHNEIAQILSCPGSRVRALVFQARSSLAANREAREIPCAVIRHRLATSRGGALRRSELRRHLRQCDGCRAFSDELRLRRRGLSVLVPIAPAVGLKRAVLGALVGSSGGGAGGGAAIAGLLGGEVAARALVTLVIAGGGTAVSVTASAGRGDAAGTRRPAASASDPRAHVAPAQLRFAVDPVTQRRRDRSSVRATAWAGEPTAEGPERTGPKRTGAARPPGQHAEIRDQSDQPRPTLERRQPGEPAEEVDSAKPPKPPQAQSQPEPAGTPSDAPGSGQSPGQSAGRGPAQSHSHGAALPPAVSIRPAPAKPGGDGSLLAGKPESQSANRLGPHPASAPDGPPHGGPSAPSNAGAGLKSLLETGKALAD